MLDLLSATLASTRWYPKLSNARGAEPAKCPVSLAQARGENDPAAAHAPTRDGSPPKAITRSITRTVVDPPWVTLQTRLSLLWTSSCQRVSLKTRRDPRPAVRLGRLVGSDDDCGPTRTPPSQPISAPRAPGLPAAAAPHRTLDASGSANRARGRRDACLTLFPVAYCALWINGVRPSSSLTPTPRAFGSTSMRNSLRKASP